MTRTHLPINYWRADKEIVNLGEGLIDLIVRGLGHEPVIAHRGPVLYTIGSNLDVRFHRSKVDAGITPTYWGMGYGGLHEPLPDAGARADIRAVRGHLTRDALDLPDTLPTGDPAFLMPTFLPLTRPRRPNGTIYAPHWENRRSAEPCLDVMGTRESVPRKLETLISAEFVLTNCLHVAICCIAYHVPFGVMLRKTDRLNMPWKWADVFHWLTTPLILNSNEWQARLWWRLYGRHITLPDLQPLLRAFPHDLAQPP